MYFIVTCVSVKKNNENLYDFRSPSATVAFGGHIEMKRLYRVLYSGRIFQFPKLLLCLCIHLQLV